MTRQSIETTASFLRTYLSDHVAGARGGLELVHRVRDNNAGTEYETCLNELARDIEQDAETLRSTVVTLGYSSRAPVREALAWLAEKLGRLKPSGSIFYYSPLARVLELEQLTSAIAGKVRLWQTLEVTSETLIPERLQGFNYAHLVERAYEQEKRVSVLHDRALQECFCQSTIAPAKRSIHGRTATERS